MLKNIFHEFLSAPSAWVLVAVNIIPLVGVTFFNWSIVELLLLYWSESAVIGFYTILKILLVRRHETSTMQANNKTSGLKGRPAKALLILFFMFHYGGFMFGHLLFILVLLGTVNADVTKATFVNIFPFLIFMLISHGISFIMNYIGNREYENATPGGLLFTPYPRIILMHVTVLFGFLFAPAVILVAGKTAVDLYSHLAEHKKYKTKGGI